MRYTEKLLIFNNLLNKLDLLIYYNLISYNVMNLFNLLTFKMLPKIKQDCGKFMLPEALL